jgi:hypothetical protein
MNRKDDKTVMRAIEAMNRGSHETAASLFQKAGNQIRNPSEKEQLWKAAERSRTIARSD